MADADRETKRGKGELEPLAIARRAVDLAADKLAEDVVLLDARKACSFTDYIVICSGESSRQVDAIHKEISDTLRKESVIPYHSEGDPESGWILLDYAGVVVHIFAAELRDFYSLESVYEKAVRLLTVQ
jgi:ribosome-associated protein